MPAPTEPLLFVIQRHRWRMCRLCREAASGRRNVAPPINGAQAPANSLGTRQQLMLETDDVDERVDGFEIRELHPTPAHAAGHASVADRLPGRARQPVRDGELALLFVADDERTGETGLHGMEIAELAPADFVHPYPLPCGAHENHLLRYMPERPDALARALEPRRRPCRQIFDRCVGLRAIAWSVVEVGGPVPGRLMVDGDHDGLLLAGRERTEAPNERTDLALEGRQPASQVPRLGLRLLRGRRAHTFDQAV